MRKFQDNRYIYTYIYFSVCVCIFPTIGFNYLIANDRNHKERTHVWKITWQA